MKQSKLKQIKRSIENFFYSTRFNIGLYKVMTSGVHGSFRQKVQNSLKKQLLYFAKVEKINRMVAMQKAVKELTDQDILDSLEKIWLPLSSLLDKKEVASHFIDYADRGGQIALDKIKSDGIFDLTNKKLLNNLDKKVENFFAQVDTTTKDWLSRSIEEGLNSGLSSYELAKKIHKEIPHVAELRSEVIAENEAAVIVGEMEVEVYKRNNIQFHKWVTSRDESVCLKCEANEREGLIPVGDTFPTGVSAPPDHVRCRCFSLPVIPLENKTLWTGN